MDEVIFDNGFMTKPFDYLEESARTASGKFHGKFVDYDKFTDQLSSFISAANALDRYKKLLFYGEDTNKQRFKDIASIKDGYTITDAMSTDNESEIKARYILHAILGIMTEAGELAEAVHAALVGNNSLDLVNLSEEIGDLQWYEAMMARALGTTFDDIQRQNIAKLRARFPDKFSTEKANDRDLEKERGILETALDLNPHNG